MSVHLLILTRWFIPLLHSFSILTGGSFKISLPLLLYRFIRSYILPVVRRRPSQIYAISILILSTRISGVPNPLFCHQFNWWRIKHNVILILVSSSLFNFFSGVVHRITFSVRDAYLFFSGVPCVPHYIITKIHLNHCKDSPCVFNFSFFLFFCYGSFFMDAIQDGSSKK